MAELNNGAPAGPGPAVPPKTVKKRKPTKRKARPARAKAAPAKPVAKAATEPTAARAAKLALNLVEFEKTTFSSATSLLSSLNDRSEKAIRHAMSSSKWMPKEGQKLIEEWQRTLRHSLKDFSKSVDKSFDLLSKYLARVQADVSGKGP